MVEQTRWIDRKFNFDFPLGVFPCILERLRFTPLRIKQLTSEIDNKVLSHEPNGKWSIKEHVGHLATVEQLWEKRVTQFLDREKELVAADMSNQKTVDANFNYWEIQKLVERFSTVRKNFIDRLEPLTETEVGLTALHPRLNKPMRLIDLVYFVAEHDDNELALMYQKSKL